MRSVTIPTLTSIVLCTAGALPWAAPDDGQSPGAVAATLLQIKSSQLPDRITGRADSDAGQTPSVCRRGYRCRSVSQPVCGELSRSLAVAVRPMVRHLSPRRCTAYRFPVSFSYVYNGHRALLALHSVRCPVQYAHVYLRVACHGYNDCSKYTGACVGLIDASIEAATRPTLRRSNYSADIEVWVSPLGRIFPEVYPPCSRDCPLGL